MWSSAQQCLKKNSSWVFRSNFDIFQTDKEHHPVRILQSVQYQITRASWLDTFKDAREQGDKPNRPRRFSIVAIFFRFGWIYYILERRAKEPRGFVQQVKHSMTFWLCVSRDIGNEEVQKEQDWLKNKIFGVCMGRWFKCGVIHPRLWMKVSFTVAYFNYNPLSRFMWKVEPNGYLNSTYVIERSSLSLSPSINDMKRILKKVFESKKPSLSSIHGLGPATSTSTSADATDLMLSIPACDADGTANAQVGVNVSVQLRPSHL